MAASAFYASRFDCRPPLETIEVEEYDPEVSCNSGTTTPGEDIWSKFEMEVAESLYPTPPRSPENKLGVGNVPQFGYPADHEQFMKSNLDMGLDMLISSWQAEQCVDMTPLLELDSELSKSSINLELDSELSKSGINLESKLHDTQREELSNVVDLPRPGLKKSLIQDCMWSAYKKLLKKDSDKPADKNTVRTSSENEYSECNQPSDCVDPTAVFPYPLSIAETRLDLGNIAGTTTPSDSEEEIDVVTIATTIESAIVSSSSPSSETNKMKSRDIVHKHKHKRESAVFSSPEHDYAKPRVHQDYRFALKRSKYTTSNVTNTQHSTHKRRKLNSGGVNPEEVARRLQDWDPKSRSTAFTSRPFYSNCSSKASGSKGSSLASSHSASDSEDCVKRVSHNVLERKRREDLRTAFFRLRDRIPHLTSKERVSKVVILEESRNYVLKLREQNTRLVVEKDALSRRRKELSSRLRKLKAARQQMYY